VGLAVERTGLEALEGFAQRGFLTTRLDTLINWARTGSRAAPWK
jgi:hypothetical protein